MHFFTKINDFFYSQQTESLRPNLFDLFGKQDFGFYDNQMNTKIQSETRNRS